METSADVNDEQSGQSRITVSKANSLDGSEGTDTMGFSDGDHGEESSEQVVVNDDDNNNNSNADDLAEGGSAGPEMSDGNSSPSRSSACSLGVKKTGGKAPKSKTKRFVGVRQRPSGRWVAEIKDSTQNIRLWLGTYDNAEDAAAAYDEAARALRGSNTRTNFGLPKDGRPELPSKAIRLLLQRAKAASTAKINPYNLKDGNSGAVDYRTSYDLYYNYQQAHHQQMYPKPEDGVVMDPRDSHFSRCNNAMDYTLAADRSASSISNPLSLNAMNSFTGRNGAPAQQQQRQGASVLNGRPSTGSTAAELGTPDIEEKFTKAFIEMYTQLPSSKRNNIGAAEIYDDGDGRCQSGSSAAAQTCSYGAVNYNTVDARGGPFTNLATGLGASGDHLSHVPGMCRPSSQVSNVNSEQPLNRDRMRQMNTLSLSAELDVGTGTGFGALPTVYSNPTRKLKDYLQSSYSGPSSILWQQASSVNGLQPPSSSSGQNPSVCPSFNASSFRQQEEARVNGFGNRTSPRWMESESTTSGSRYYSEQDIPVSTPGIFRSISDSLLSPGVPFPSTDFLPQEALWSQTQELSTVPAVC
ncbi:unnamed protein product [Calypogeia fissa]